jgi:heme-degrading monooxygenase HmoA
VTRLQSSEDLLEEVVRQFEQRTVPVLEGQDGYQGYALLADAESGLAMAITYWESAESLRASEEVGRQERARAAKTAQTASDPVVERYEVVSAS